jgi:hypothetical protein
MIEDFQLAVQIQFLIEIQPYHVEIALHMHILLVNLLAVGFGLPPILFRLFPVQQGIARGVLLVSIRRRHSGGGPGIPSLPSLRFSYQRQEGT